MIKIGVYARKSRDLSTLFLYITLYKRVKFYRHRHAVNEKDLSMSCMTCNIFSVLESKNYRIIVIINCPEQK